MTVGKMVMTAVGRMPKSNLMIADALRAKSWFEFLGLWDAEVYEGQVDKMFRPGGIEPEGCIWVRGIAEPGASVRVIVLPQEETE